MSKSQGTLLNMTSIYLTHNDKILLLYRQGSSVVNNVWIGSAGGHFEENELNDAYACVLRELYEELSVSEDMIEGLSLKYITLRNVKGVIRLNYYFFAELKEADTLELHSNEGTVKWFPIDQDLSKLDMPFSAGYMIKHYMETGRFTDQIYGGIANENGVTFTVFD